jgi:hypothetical protein
MPPAATIACAARGRTRFRIRSRRLDEAYFSRLERELGAAPEVERVHVNPITASVLVHHRGEAGALSRYAAERELFELSTLLERPDDLLRQQASALDRQLQELSGRSLDLRSVALVLLMTVGVVQLLRREIAAPAVTVFWYAAALLAGTEKELG